MNKLSVTRAVYEILDSHPAGMISGRELQHMTALRTGREPYHSTVLEKARTYADLSGAMFECIDNKRSLYRFEPGFGLGDAILGGRE